MVLSDEDVIKFQNIFKDEFGKEISKETAYEKGVKLLRLMSIVYKPMSEKEYKLIQKHRLARIELLEDKLSKNPL